MQITIWGTGEDNDSDVHDYANKEWAGLMQSFYRSRLAPASQLFLFWSMAWSCSWHVPTCKKGAYCIINPSVPCAMKNAYQAVPQICTVKNMNMHHEEIYNIHDTTYKMKMHHEEEQALFLSVSHAPCMTWGQEYQGQKARAMNIMVSVQARAKPDVWPAGLM